MKIKSSQFFFFLLIAIGGLLSEEGCRQKDHSIYKLIKKLQDKDPIERETAAKALGMLGSKALPAVPALLKALRDKDFVVREAAVKALERIGNPALPHLRKVLSEPELQWYLLCIIYRIQGKLTKKEQKILLNGKSFDQIPKSLIPLLYKLLASDRRIRLEAAKKLGMLKASPAVPALLKALRDIDIYKTAEEALAKIGKPSVPALIKIIQDDNWFLRPSAIRTLAKIGKPAIPHIIKILGDQSEEVRATAAMTLGKIGAKAASAIPALIKALGDSSWIVRKESAEALGKIGAKAASAVPALIHALKNSSGIEREAVAKALGKIGPKASPAVPALLQALNDKKSRVRITAAWALLRISGQPNQKAQQILLQALQHRETQFDAVSILRELGQKAKFAVPALKKLLKTADDSELKEQIRQILEQFQESTSKPTKSTKSEGIK